MFRIFQLDSSNAKRNLSGDITNLPLPNGTSAFQSTPSNRNLKHDRRVNRSCAVRFTAHKINQCILLINVSFWKGTKTNQCCVLISLLHSMQLSFWKGLQHVCFYEIHYLLLWLLWAKIFQCALKYLYSN